MPFGAVQLSPDTGVRDWDWSSGYHHDDSTLMGFSHTHLSGTGVGDMLDLLLVPRTGAVVLNPGVDPEARSKPEGTYRSRFSHSDEKGEPGYYSVLTRERRWRKDQDGADGDRAHRTCAFHLSRLTSRRTCSSTGIMPTEKKAR